MVILIITIGDYIQVLKYYIVTVMITMIINDNC